MKKLYQEMQFRYEMDEYSDLQYESNYYKEQGYDVSCPVLQDENGDFFLLVVKKNFE